jgi:hypothetical protein
MELDKSGRLLKRPEPRFHDEMLPIQCVPTILDTPSSDLLRECRVNGKIAADLNPGGFVATPGAAAGVGEADKRDMVSTALTQSPPSLQGCQKVHLEFPARGCLGFGLRIYW